MTASSATERLRQLRGVVLAVALAAACAGGTVRAAAPPPALLDAIAAELAQQVAAAHDALERDAALRRTYVDRYLRPHFDLETSCRLILRDAWTAATPDERRRFVDAFYRYLLASHAAALPRFRRDTITVHEAQDAVIGGSYRVHAELRLDEDSRYPVEFYMRLGDAGWRIVDIIVEGVSYVRTYRSDFAAEIRASGLDGLIAWLDGQGALEDRRPAEP